ncbi:glutathione S-transferase family protein [Dongia deserti]|uniref:glutathione S-transferase family protein n=1 Tax=Dongia deserti TaxID=2268030 RepID=UPI000E648B12|nr:glutathione S-transferase [Dongia deserti]
MEPVLFYGVPHGCSFGSIVALEWLGQPYRLCRIEMLAPKDERYLRINPKHLTPTLLMENGEALGESLAILLNIAARDLGQRLGFLQGTRAFDRLNSVLAFLHMELHGAFAPAWTAYKLPEDATKEKEMLRNLAREQVAKAYVHVEHLLSSSAWLAGDVRTVADAYLAGIARWGEDLRLFDLGKEYPRLYKHLQKLEHDKAVIFAHAIEDAKPTTSSGHFLGHVTLDDLQPRLAA